MFVSVSKIKGYCVIFYVPMLVLYIIYIHEVLYTCVTHRGSPRSGGISSCSYKIPMEKYFMSCSL